MRGAGTYEVQSDYPPGAVGFRVSLRAEKSAKITEAQRTVNTLAVQLEKNGMSCDT